MKLLTKDNLENMIDAGCIDEADRDEILKNQEDAKKWNEHKDTRIIFQNRVIIERLKKRIEECKTNSLKISMKDNWAEYKNQITLLPELQKIIEGEK